MKILKTFCFLVILLFTVGWKSDDSFKSAVTATLRKQVLEEAK